jgi:LmbE family N-acetylglucosaminyl deacetylase/DNA-binding CsgD family transcriptional regulator
VLEYSATRSGQAMDGTAPKLTLAIAPHLDDAVLSAGGYLAQLASAGGDVLVLTVFAGQPKPPYSPLAEVMHGIWRLRDDPVGARRAEDRLALGCLGARALHARHLDAVYRTARDGSWLVGEHERPTKADVGPEPELVDAVTAEVAALVDEYRPQLILTCAAVGGHVDHRRTRQAVVRAVGDDHRLWLWTDLPYADNDMAELLKSVEAFPEAIGAAAWEAKLRAVGCYRSQHSMLWPQDPDFRVAMERQAGQLSEALGRDGRHEVFLRSRGEESLADFAWLDRAASRIKTLTGQQYRVLMLLGSGLDNAAIARAIGRTERTVKLHVSEVLRRLGVETRLQAGIVAYAVSSGAVAG